MATHAQIIANKANSQKSSGPVTDQGEAKSSRNRFSHGFASTTRSIEGENPEPFKALLNDLIDQLATPPQQILVEMMAHNRWISLLQGDVLIRYHTTADRAFHKAHAELLKARKQTPNREIGFESQNAPQPAEAVAEAPGFQPDPPKNPREMERPLQPIRSCILRLTLTKALFSYRRSPALICGPISSCLLTSGSMTPTPRTQTTTARPSSPSKILKNRGIDPVLTTRTAPRCGKTEKIGQPVTAPPVRNGFVPSKAVCRWQQSRKTRGSVTSPPVRNGFFRKYYAEFL